MNRKSMYSAAVLLTVINLAALGTLLYYHFHNANGESLTETRDRQFEQVRHELLLSSSQIAQFNAFRDVFYAEMDSLSSQLAARRMELTDELWRSPIDTTRINALVKSIGHAQSAAQRAIIAHLLNVNTLLTPEQQGKLHEIIRERFSSGADWPLPDPR